MNELSGANFSMVNGKLKVTSPGPALLMIRADWCSFCERFLGVYKKIGNRLGKAFPLYSIEDTHISKDLGKALNFRGYPTLKFIDANGYIISEYSGERTEEAILDEICKVYHKCAK